MDGVVPVHINNFFNVTAADKVVYTVNSEIDGSYAFIYLWINTFNWKKYYGQTEGAVKTRTHNHLGGNCGARVLACALRKYGTSAFVCVKLLAIPTNAPLPKTLLTAYEHARPHLLILDYVESSLITSPVVGSAAKAGAQRGYNVQSGGRRNGGYNVQSDSTNSTGVGKGGNNHTAVHQVAMIAQILDSDGKVGSVRCKAASATSAAGAFDWRYSGINIKCKKNMSERLLFATPSPPLLTLPRRQGNDGVPDHD